MTDADLLHAERDRLRSLVESLQTTADGIVESATDVATDDEHDPEGHTIAFERQQTIALLRDSEAQLAEVELAFGRVGDDTYGRCEICQGDIPAERLEALPSTRTCVACATPNARPL